MFHAYLHQQELSVITTPLHFRMLIVDRMLAIELQNNRIAGPFDKVPLPGFHCSPLGLVPKKQESKFRLIHDLSFPKGDSINDSIPREHCSVQYEDFDHVVSIIVSLGSHCLIAKADIESTFRILPISPKA